MAITPVVAALIFRALLNPLYGWVDYYLREWGLIDRPIEWLSEPLTAWVAVIGLDVWQWTSFVALIVLAGLQGLDSEPREAAAIDGAGRWQTFRFVTLPMIKPFIVIALLLRTVQAFKVFETIQVLTNGGPAGATEVFNLTIYRVSLQNFQVGYGAALGIIFLFMLSLDRRPIATTGRSQHRPGRGVSHDHAPTPAGSRTRRDPSRHLRRGACRDRADLLDGHDIVQGFEDGPGIAAAAHRLRVGPSTTTRT